MQCAKDGCQKLVDPGRKYCSRDHAPFGMLVDPQPKPAASSVYKRKKAPEPMKCEHGAYFKDTCWQCTAKNYERECIRLRGELLRLTLEFEARK